MARTSSGDRDELERAIGPRGSTKITSENRNEVRQWLRARGCPAEITQGLKVSILDKAYNDETSFAELNTVIEAQNPFQPIAQEEPKPMQSNPFTPAAISEPSKPNRFPAPCSHVGCGVHVAAFNGTLVKTSTGNLVYCADHTPTNSTIAAIEATNPTPFKPVPDAPRMTIDGTPIKPAPKANDIGAAITQAIAGMLAAMPPQMDEEKIIDLIKTYGSQPQITTQQITITAPEHQGEPITLDPTILRHEVFPDVLAEIVAGSHVYLVGPAGSGKSTLAEQIAAALERKFYSTNAVKSAFGLVGYMNATGAYVRTQFRDAFENGGVFLFDEIDASSADAIVTLNGALAQSWFAFPDGMIQRHKDFVCVAGANTYGTGQDRQYVGRNQLDAASLDRFAFIEMGYDDNLEDALCPNKAWLHCVRAARMACVALKLRHVISPRASIGGAKSLAAGKAWDKVRKAWLYKGLDDATVDKITAQAGSAINEPRTARRAA